MVQQISNSFTAYSFTPEEEIQAQILTSLQKQYLQTKRAEITEQILGLKIDLSNPAPDRDFAVQHAYLNGQKEVIDWILTCSEVAEKEVFEAAQQNRHPGTKPNN